jgi:hypothetical protein
MIKAVRIAAAVALAVALSAGGAGAEKMPGTPKAGQETPPPAKGEGAWDAAPVIDLALVQGIKTEVRIAALPAPAQSTIRSPSRKETHHLMLELTDPRSGRPITRGTVSVRVMAPDKSVQTRGMMRMGDRYNAFLALGSAGRYGVTVEYVLRDRRVRTLRFWYVVK